MGEGKTRFDVPGQFKAKDYAMLQKMEGSIWQERLRAVCHKVLEDIGEEDVYTSFTKNVPAPKKRAVVEVKESHVGAEAFTRSLCVQPNSTSEDSTKKKKKSKKAKGMSTQ